MFTPHGLGQLQRVPIPRSGRSPGPILFDAVLFDRDGTLVVDVPCIGDPAVVEPGSGAGEAFDRLRWAGPPMSVITNRSGIARGLFSGEQTDAVQEEQCASR